MTQIQGATRLTLVQPKVLIVSVVFMKKALKCAIVFANRRGRASRNVHL